MCVWAQHHNDLLAHPFLASPSPVYRCVWVKVCKPALETHLFPSEHWLDCSVANPRVRVCVCVSTAPYVPFWPLGASFADCWGTASRHEQSRNQTHLHLRCPFPQVLTRGTLKINTDLENKSKGSPLTVHTQTLAQYNNNDNNNKVNLLSAQCPSSPTREISRFTG